MLVYDGYKVVRAVGYDAPLLIRVPVFKCKSHCTKFRATDESALQQLQEALLCRPIRCTPDIVRVSPRAVLTRLAYDAVVSDMLSVALLRRVADDWERRFLKRGIRWLANTQLWLKDMLVLLSPTSVDPIMSVLKIAYEATEIIEVRCHSRRHVHPSDICI